MDTCWLLPSNQVFICKLSDKDGLWKGMLTMKRIMDHPISYIPLIGAHSTMHLTHSNFKGMQLSHVLEQDHGPFVIFAF